MAHKNNAKILLRILPPSLPSFRLLQNFYQELVESVLHLSMGVVYGRCLWVLSMGVVLFSIFLINCVISQDKKATISVIFDTESATSLELTEKIF